MWKKRLTIRNIIAHHKALDTGQGWIVAWKLKPDLITLGKLIPASVAITTIEWSRDTLRAGEVDDGSASAEGRMSASTPFATDGIKSAYTGRRCNSILMPLEAEPCEETAR
jgi:glutamate-1-semialdehyde aminotransferase